MSGLIAKKRKNKILKLKLLIENVAYSEEELSIGANELSEILKEFSDRISLDQKKKFNDLFFGNQKSQSQKQPPSGTETKLSILKEIKKSDGKQKSVLQGPEWAKKLYKQIVQRSHPDKYIDFPIKAIKEKYTSIYIKTVDAYHNNDIGILLSLMKPKPSLL